MGDLPRKSGQRVAIAEVAALQPEGLARLFAGTVRAARSVGATGLFVNAPHTTVVEEILLTYGKIKVGEGGVMHRRIHATEAMMQEIDRCYESGSAYWWNTLDGY